MTIFNPTKYLEKKYEPKGEEVEHPLKDKLRSILPERYTIKALIQYEIERKGIDYQEKPFTRKEYANYDLYERNPGMYSFLKNLRELRDIGQGNPYELMITAEEIEKQKLQNVVTLEGEYRILCITSKRPTLTKGQFKLQQMLIFFGEGEPEDKEGFLKNFLFGKKIGVNKRNLDLEE